MNGVAPRSIRGEDATPEQIADDLIYDFGRKEAMRLLGHSIDLMKQNYPHRDAARWEAALKIATDERTDEDAGFPYIIDA